MKVHHKDMRAIIFDLGRVLIEYDHQQTLTALTAVSRTNIEALRILFQTISRPLGTGEINERALHQLLQEQFATTADYNLFEQAFCAGIRRNESALTYALALRQPTRVRLGIISNTNAAHTRWLRRILPEFSQFDSVILSNEAGMIKPDAEIYHLALQQLGVAAKQTLFVDDLPENVAGAKTIGMAGIIHEDWTMSRPLLEEWLFDDRSQ